MKALEQANESHAGREALSSVLRVIDEAASTLLSMLFVPVVGSSESSENDKHRPCVFECKVIT
jgi:poly-D-alanine transfer protein DltD